jgi:hypothetical protein
MGISAKNDTENLRILIALSGVKKISLKKLSSAKD